MAICQTCAGTGVLKSPGPHPPLPCPACSKALALPTSKQLIQEISLVGKTPSKFSVVKPVKPLTAVEKLSDEFVLGKVFNAIAIKQETMMMEELKASTVIAADLEANEGFKDLGSVLQKVKADLTAQLVDKIVGGMGIKPVEQPMTFMGMKIVTSPYLPKGVTAMISDGSGKPNAMGIVFEDGKPGVIMSQDDFDECYADAPKMAALLKKHVHEAMADDLEALAKKIDDEILFGSPEHKVLGLQFDTLAEFKEKHEHKFDDEIETGNLSIFDEGGIEPKEVWIDGKQYVSMTIHAQEFGDSIPKSPEFLVQGKPMQNFKIEYPVETKPFGDGYAQKIAALPGKLPITVKFTTPVTKEALENGTGVVPELGQQIHVGDPDYGVNGQFVITHLEKDYDIANAQYLFHVTALEVLDLDSKQLPGKIDVDPSIFATEGDEMYGGAHHGSWKSKHGFPQQIPKQKVAHPKGYEFGTTQLAIVAQKLLNGLITPGRVDFAQSMLKQAHPTRKLTLAQWEYIDKFANGDYDIGAKKDAKPDRDKPMAAADTKKWQKPGVTIVDMPSDMDALNALFDSAIEHGSTYPSFFVLLDEKRVWLYRAVATKRYTLRLGHDNGKRIGWIAPEGDFVWGWEGDPDDLDKTRMIEAVSLLVQDPIGAVTAYAKATSTCCFCEKLLETPESVHWGYGPTCAKKWGLKHGAVPKCS